MGIQMLSHRMFEYLPNSENDIPEYPLSRLFKITINFNV